jgi:protocatechuate 3,4-dioxygenase beta subunit
VTRHYDPVNKEHYLAAFSRRRVIQTGAVLAGIAATGAGTVRMVTAQTTGDTAATAETVAMCVLTPELTEGPYYLDDMIMREDITEGKAGLPLALEILVLDATACTPIENAAVEIWHCDANGYYSGFTESNPGGNQSYVDDGSDPNTFLRGLVLTGSDGIAKFQTIYPGWYTGRDIHIHMKVHVGGESTNGTYDGGHVSHTGQLAFDDEISDQVALIEPYASRDTTFTRLEEDGVFSGVEEDDATFFLALTQVDASNLASGMTGTITIGIDPDTEQSSDAGMGGGQGGGNGRGPGNGTPPNPPGSN